MYFANGCCKTFGIGAADSDIVSGFIANNWKRVVVEVCNNNGAFPTGWHRPTPRIQHLDNVEFIEDLHLLVPALLQGDESRLGTAIGVIERRRPGSMDSFSHARRQLITADKHLCG